MRNTAILGGIGLLIAGGLVILNPRLLIPATLGLAVGLGWRWYRRYRQRSTAPGHVAPPESGRSKWLRRAIAIGGLVTVFLAASVATVFLGSGVSAPRPTVETALTYRATYDPSKASWTTTQRFELSEDAVKESLRLLGVFGRTVPEGATPEQVAALLATEFGSDWTVELVNGRPVLVRSLDVGMPEAGPWSYDVSLPVAVAFGRVLDIRPNDDSKAVLDAPRHLVLEAAPPIRSTELLPGDARETLRIDVSDDSTAVRLQVAPSWARHDVTAWAMTLSLGGLAQLGVGAIVAVMAAAFGTTVWARMRGFAPVRAFAGPSTAASPGEGTAAGLQATPTPPPTKILFLAANPVGTDPLRLDEEIRAIDEALRMAEFRDRFEIEQQWAVRVGDLQQALLRHQPQIVHFSGHGASTSQLVVEAEAGTPQAIPQDDLSDLFDILEGDIRLVVLNACYSDGQAKAIGKHIDCVVGMTTAVGDEAAIEFATAFYRALGYGRDIRTAFELGTNQIGLQNLPDEDTPHLLAKTSKAAHFSFVSSDEGSRPATKGRPTR